MPSAARARSVSPSGHYAVPASPRPGDLRDESIRRRTGSGRAPDSVSAATAARRSTRGRTAAATAAASAPLLKTSLLKTPLLKTPRWFPAAALITAPVLGAVAGKALGGYHGPLFAVLTVAGASLATASATPNGRWWVIPSLPPVAWLVAAVAELLWHDPPYRDTKAKAVGLVHATTHVFPVILVAVLAMGLVCAAATVASKRQHPRGGRRA